MSKVTSGWRRYDQGEHRVEGRRSPDRAASPSRAAFDPGDTDHLAGVDMIRLEATLHVED
jgi:hypothetical protein